MASAICCNRVWSSAACVAKAVHRKKLSQTTPTSRAEGFCRRIWTGQVKQSMVPCRGMTTWPGEVKPIAALLHGRHEDPKAMDKNPENGNIAWDEKETVHGKGAPSETQNASPSSEILQKKDLEETNKTSSASARPEGGERRRYRILGDVHKAYEETSRLLPGCWIVVRVDGRAFHRFVEVHGFKRPHDLAAIGLMDAVATAVVEEFADIIMAYGQSDEYSFVFHKNTDIYSRRTSKFESLIASLFTSHYVMKWPSFFDTPLKLAPSFDGRAVCYPSADLVQNYIVWRQFDCHTNCLFNTCYWSLVDGRGKTGRQAGKILHKASKAFMNELLFSEFDINYNNMAPVLKRGTLLVRRRERVELRTKEETPFTPAGTPYVRTITHVDAHHDDVAVGSFWNDYCAQLLKDHDDKQ